MPVGTIRSHLLENCLSSASHGDHMPVETIGSPLLENCLSVHCVVTPHQLGPLDPICWRTVFPVCHVVTPCQLEQLDPICWKTVSPVCQMVTPCRSGPLESQSMTIELTYTRYPGGFISLTMCLPGGRYMTLYCPFGLVNCMVTSWALLFFNLIIGLESGVPALRSVTLPEIVLRLPDVSPKAPNVLP